MDDFVHGILVGFSILLFVAGVFFLGVEVGADFGAPWQDTACHIEPSECGR